MTIWSWFGCAPLHWIWRPSDRRWTLRRRGGGVNYLFFRLHTIQAIFTWVLFNRAPPWIPGDLISMLRITHCVLGFPRKSTSAQLTWQGLCDLAFKFHQQRCYTRRRTQRAFSVPLWNKLPPEVGSVLYGKFHNYWSLLPKVLIVPTSLPRLNHSAYLTPLGRTYPYELLCIPPRLIVHSSRSCSHGQ